MKNKEKKMTNEDLKFYLNTMLFNKGLVGLQGQFLANRTPISQSLLKTILKDSSGLTGLSLYDKTYYVTDWSVWIKIIDKLFIDQMIYMADTLDCDKYAKIFSAISSIMGLNTAGMITGDVVDLDNNRTFRHGFNFIVYKDGPNFKVRCYEPQTDDDKIVTSDFVVLDRMNWKYRFNWGIF